jgi:hypothetical protein
VASDPALGEIRMNGGTLPIPKDYTGQYFREYPITATAAPAEGARFLRWEATDNAVLSDPLSPTVEITFTGSFTLTAVFE